MAAGKQCGETRNERKRKQPKHLISKEVEASADAKPECPVKDSRGCSLYLQQHHRESQEGQSRKHHEEKHHISLHVL